ncbi:MAG TPA: hypothetical protein VIK91_18835, partial [Nannocystis sp.]
ACSVDADCDAAHFCELRICVPGCLDDTDCEGGATCDTHGRCAGDEAHPSSPVKPPRLRDQRTVLAFGLDEARTVLYNDGSEPLDYRVTAVSPALLFDPAPSVIAPGNEAEIIVSVDLESLTAVDRVLPVMILTSGGAIAWSIELEGPATSGRFAGSVLTGDDLLSLGSDRLAVELDFLPDGTIRGRLDEEASLAWPRGILSGTWTPAGDVTLVLRDVTPAEPWEVSPLARQLGRRLTLEGKHTAAGIEGHATLEITGMRDDPVALAGSFALRKHGPLAGPIEPPPALPPDPAPPTWLAPPGLDDDACAELGVRYGTPTTLLDQNSTCSACAGLSCTPEEMLGCAADLWDAAYHLPDVLADLAGTGQVKPPSGAWDWMRCTADEPTYEGGMTCHDAAAVRCAMALIRRGAPEIEGPWGEATLKLGTLYATDEAEAVMLLATEAELDAAFAYLDDLGEPTSDPLAREIEHLSAARESIAAALAPTLAPTFAALLADEPPSPKVDAAERVPLRLLARFASLTAAWATLARRAGHDLDELRAAVRHAAITVQAGALEVRARLTDDQLPAAQLDLLSLGPAMQALAAAHRGLAPDASPFGLPAAYVPLALGPEDLAHGRTNFEAVAAIARDDVARFEE